MLAGCCLLRLAFSHTSLLEPLPTAAKTFEELGLSQELLQGLYTEMKFERPSKVQVG